MILVTVALVFSLVDHPLTTVIAWMQAPAGPYPVVHSLLLLLLMHDNLDVADLHTCPIARTSLAVLTTGMVLASARLVLRKTAGCFATLDAAFLLDAVDAFRLA